MGEQRLLRMRGFRYTTVKSEVTRMGVAFDSLMRVVEAGDGAWTLELTMREPADSELSREQARESPSHVVLFGVKLRVRVSVKGEMTLLNFDEVHAAAKEAAHALVDKERRAKPDRKAEPAWLAEAYRTIESFYDDERTATALLLGDYQLLFSHLGVRWTIDKQVSEETKFPTQMISREVKATKTTRVVGVPGKGRQRTIQTSVTPDLAELTAAWIEGVKRMLPKDAKVSDELFEKSTFNVRDETSRTFEMDSGWMVKASTLRTIEMKSPVMGDRMQRETMDYELTDVVAEPVK